MLATAPDTSRGRVLRHLSPNPAVGKAARLTARIDPGTFDAVQRRRPAATGI